MGPRAGLDGRKISSPPGFFFFDDLEESKCLFLSAQYKNTQVKFGVPEEPITSMISEIPFCFAVLLSAKKK